MKWTEAHSASERLAEAAHSALRNGETSIAQEFFRKAARAETEALSALGPDKPRTYGITAVSAASLWLKAGEAKEAIRIADAAFSAPNLPRFAADQLRELQDAVRNSTPLQPVLGQTSNLLANFYYGVLQRFIAGPNTKSNFPPAAVPSQRASAMELIWERGKLTVSLHAAALDLEQPTFEAALSALKAEINSVAKEMLKSNLERNIPNYLTQVAAQISDSTPAQKNLFRLGHAAAALNSLGSRAETEWPEVIAARYRALEFMFDRTLRQAPAWREFIRNATKQSFSQTQIENAGALATEVANTLRDENALTFVDPAVPQALEELVAEFNNVEGEFEKKSTTLAQKELVALDLVESVNNTLKSIAQAATRTVDAANSDRAFKWLSVLVSIDVAATSMTMDGAFTIVRLLVSKYPEAFQWLDRLASFLR